MQGSQTLRGSALPVVSAAFAMTKGTASAESADGAEKAPLRLPGHWSLRRMARSGAGAKAATAQREARHRAERPPREGEQEGYVRTRKEGDRVCVTHLWRPP